MANDIVQVMMTVTQKVTYSRIFEMPRAEYEELDAKLNSGNNISWREEEIIAEKYMDYARDWLDAEDTEIQDFGLASDE